MSGGAIVPSDLSGAVASPGPTSVDNTAAAPIGDAMSPAGTSPADAMSPVNAPTTASDLSGAVPPSSATGDSAGGDYNVTGLPGQGFDPSDTSFGGYNATGLPGDSIGTAGGGTADSPGAGTAGSNPPGAASNYAGANVTGTPAGGTTAAQGPGANANQNLNAQGQPVGQQQAQTGQNPAAGGGKAAGGGTPQSNMQAAGNLINQLAKLMGGGGGFNAGQAQNLLNQMGMPNRGGLTFGQRAQLRMMAHQQRSAAQQALWNAGVRNPRADSRYVGMMQSIQAGLASQAQNMMQQNFQNALASNQQLLQAAQMQMNQQTQQGNAMQSLMQALGRTAGSSSTVGTAGGAGSGGAGTATASA